MHASASILQISHAMISKNTCILP